MIAVIRSEAQYEEVLARVTDLAALDPPDGSEEGRELEVLAVLLQDYERKAYSLAAPNPIAAIRLRMEQMNLAPKDLAQILGSRGKVSEVLSGKRPLSLAMIRALHETLGIPLASLVAAQPTEDEGDIVEWDKFPIREMLKRGWLARSKQSASRIGFEEARRMMEGFFSGVGGPTMALGVLRKSDHLRTGKSIDKYALAAWAGYVRQRSAHAEVAREFRHSDWSPAGFEELRRLSRFDVGPRLAVQYLEERGIAVDVVPHLPRTRLDGAAMVRADGTPIIALTIRRDRLDNFWFTLFHELMHVVLHLKCRHAEAGAGVFLDDLEVTTDVDALEKEADRAAREALVPTAAWERSAVRYAVAPATVAQLAMELGVADAVVAGRVRYENNNYRLLSSMVGSGGVRALFPEVSWGKAEEEN